MSREQRASARLAAVQALYQMDVAAKGLNINLEVDLMARYAARLVEARDTEA